MRINIDQFRLDLCRFYVNSSTEIMTIENKAMYALLESCEGFLKSPGGSAFVTSSIEDIQIFNEKLSAFSQLMAELKTYQEVAQMNDDTTFKEA